MLTVSFSNTESCAVSSATQRLPQRRSLAVDHGRGVRSRGLETYFILYCDFDLVNSVFSVYSRGGRRSASKAEGKGESVYNKLGLPI